MSLQWYGRSAWRHMGIYKSSILAADAFESLRHFMEIGHTVTEIAILRQTALRSIQPFLQGSPLCATERDTQTVDTHRQTTLHR